MSSRDTTILLIRHGHTDAIGRRLVGRLPGIHLTDIGRVQAERLCDRLRDEPISAVYSSPLERAIETADPLARSRGLPLRIRDDLTEVDFGDWTGLTFDALGALPEWERFNRERATAPVPGGERASVVQQRIVSALHSFGRVHPGDTIAAVSHADVIRAAVLHVIRAPLDSYDRFEISPASVTAVRLTAEGPRLPYVNATVDRTR